MLTNDLVHSVYLAQALLVHDCRPCLLLEVMEGERLIERLKSADVSTFSVIILASLHRRDVPLPAPCPAGVEREVRLRASAGA